MAQLTSLDLIGSYHHKQLASGERAKWDYANYYTQISLKEDSSFVWQRQKGRLSATFEYEYGTWSLEDDVLILQTTHQARDKKLYYQTNDEDRYKNDPFSVELEREKYNRSYTMTINTYEMITQGELERKHQVIDIQDSSDVKYKKD